ncbi:hypothetical protein ABIA27_002421 [Sinorhizobium fredii]
MDELLNILRGGIHRNLQRSVRVEFETLGGLMGIAEVSRNKGREMKKRIRLPYRRKRLADRPLLNAQARMLAHRNPLWIAHKRRDGVASRKCMLNKSRPDEARRASYHQFLGTHGRSLSLRLLLQDERRP